MTGLCILCKFYLCKFHPSICSPIQTTVLKTTSKCLTIEILLWDSLSHPIFPSGASELLVATSLVPTDGSRGSTRNVGNSCSSTCSHLNSVGAAKGKRWEEQLQLQNPLASQEQRLLPSVNFSMENTTRIPKEQEHKWSTCQAPELQ